MSTGRATGELGSGRQNVSVGDAQRELREMRGQNPLLRSDRSA